MVEKLHISVIYESIILIFLVNLPLIFIYKLFKKVVQIKPPGEPQEQHPDKV